MDERQRVIKHTFTREELKGMTIDQLIGLVGKAGAGAKFHGTGVVRKADGSIRYDEGAKPGDYHEPKVSEIGSGGLSKGSGM
jgi:hypothetical protein